MKDIRALDDAPDPELCELIAQQVAGLQVGRKAKAAGFGKWLRSLY